MKKFLRAIASEGLKYYLIIPLGIKYVLIHFFTFLWILSCDALC